jgi:hypothetical protein
MILGLYSIVKSVFLWQNKSGSCLFYHLARPPTLSGVLNYLPLSYGVLQILSGFTIHVKSIFLFQPPVQKGCKKVNVVVILGNHI